MTKTELLELMKQHDVCRDATDYVTQHPSDDASVVGAECTDVSWLIWTLGREKRLSRFVRVCVVRAKKTAESCKGSRYYAANAAARAANAAARAASYAAADAADYAAARAYAAFLADAADAADAANAEGGSYAAYAAAYATRLSSRTHERAAQLKGLRRIWIDWCAGKEAEK